MGRSRRSPASTCSSANSPRPPSASIHSSPRSFAPAPSTPAPDAAALLVEIRAVSYGGAYVLEEERRRREGFVEVAPGQWALAARVELDDLIATQRRHPVRRLELDEFYREAIAAGHVEAG